MSPLSFLTARRAPVLALLAALSLAACAPTVQTTPSAIPPEYEARTDTGPKGEVITIPAVNPVHLRERNRRTWVDYNGPEAPETLVVDPYARFLYHVKDGGKAMRFGISVGDAGRGFHGSATVRRKEAWPYWAPTRNMIRTMPETYASLAGGLPGGLVNPLGARALYLYRGGRDTMYRIHGTMDPASIGKATTAGCIRVFNQDILDIYDETPMGTPVRVRSRAESLALEGPVVQTPDGFVVTPAEAQRLAEEAAKEAAAAAKKSGVRPGA